jgi:hypothetical protein
VRMESMDFTSEGLAEEGVGAVDWAGVWAIAGDEKVMVRSNSAMGFIFAPQIIG